MAKHTIYLNESIEENLKKYISANNMKKISSVIRLMIEKGIKEEEKIELFYEISEKLNRILYRQNLNKKLLEQLFTNMGFPINEDPDKDKLLKKFYEKNNFYRAKGGY